MQFWPPGGQSHTGASVAGLMTSSPSLISAQGDWGQACLVQLGTAGETEEECVFGVS